jgi:hypothetical protein
VAAARWRSGRIALATSGAILLAHAGVYLHTTLRGKFRSWERELDRAGLKGDEQLLDLGCGRGAVLIEAARRLPAGHAVGVDLWTADQSGNRPEATLARQLEAGAGQPVQVVSGEAGQDSVALVWRLDSRVGRALADLAGAQEITVVQPSALARDEQLMTVGSQGRPRCELLPVAVAVVERADLEVVRHVVLSVWPASGKHCDVVFGGIATTPIPSW